MKKRYVRQLLLMIILTIIIQGCTLIKTSLIASNFGVSVEIDAFNFANSIATFVYSFIGAGVTTILIPNLIDKEKRKSINIFITILYSIGLISMLIIIFLRKNLIEILSHNSNSYFINTCSAILIILIINEFINSLTGVSNAVLQFEEQFNRTKLVLLITNLILVIGLILNKKINIYYYSILILITTIMNLIAQLYFVKKTGYKYSIDINIKDVQFMNMLRVFIPIVFSTGLYQVSLMIDTTIASRLGEGQISILNYSNSIISMINMLLLANITAFLYPKMSKSINKKNSQEDLFKFITIINAFMCFIVVLFICVGKDSIQLLYQRGEFSSYITRIVFICSLIYIIALPINAMRDLIYKYFYIHNDTYTPFKNSLIISIFNILLSIFMSRYIGIYGVIAGTAITSYISILLIMIKFRNKFRFKFKVKNIIIENLKIIICSVISLIIFNFIRLIIHIENIFISLLVYSSIIFIEYLIILIILKFKLIHDYFSEIKVYEVLQNLKVRLLNYKR